MAGAANRPGRGSARNVLPDVLEPDMVTVFCGDSPGRRSDEQREYYADKRNQFWGILAEIGLTTWKLDSRDYRKLAALRIGLTNLDQASVLSDEEVLRDHDNADAYNADTLCSKIEEYRPRILAFNGKTPAKPFLKEQFGVKDVDYGLQSEYRLGDTKVFVLPSTAGSGRGYWDEKPWRELADLHREILAE